MGGAVAATTGVGGSGGVGGGSVTFGAGSAADWGTLDHNSASTVTGVGRCFHCTPMAKNASNRPCAAIASANARSKPGVGGGANS